jgi:hypothetical protein
VKDAAHLGFLMMRRALPGACPTACPALGHA